MTPLPLREARADACTVCPARVDKVCGECGCPVTKKVGWAEIKCELNRWPDEGES